MGDHIFILPKEREAHHPARYMHLTLFYNKLITNNT